MLFLKTKKQKQIVLPIHSYLVPTKQAFYNCQQNAIAVTGFILLLDKRATTEKQRTTILMYFLAKSLSFTSTCHWPWEKKKSNMFWGVYELHNCKAFQQISISWSQFNIIKGITEWNTEWLGGTTNFPLVWQQINFVTQLHKRRISWMLMLMPKNSSGTLVWKRPYTDIRKKNGF